MGIKRYSCTVSDKRGFEGECMSYDKRGKWVKYSVYEMLRKENERLKRKLK
ncbi:coil containing protein [Vibrio phage 1.170.O._10N.261.52.C3]|nr:coil containing protein [Vibrio phage 1.170.O._10N.261.52.C3]